MSTMYTLLQRLVAKDYPDGMKSLNYDHMGAAEYEFGATLWPRLVVSQDECVIITDAVLHWRQYQIDDMQVHIRYPKYLETNGGKPMIAQVVGNLIKGDFHNKMPPVYTHMLQDKQRPLAGWLMLEPIPMLIYQVKYVDRAEVFMSDIYRQAGMVGTTPTLADARCLYEVSTGKKPYIPKSIAISYPGQ